MCERSGGFALRVRRLSGAVFPKMSDHYPVLLEITPPPPAGTTPAAGTPTALAGANFLGPVSSHAEEPPGTSSLEL